jgi:hypothetical protein
MVQHLDIFLQIRQKIEQWYYVEMPQPCHSIGCLKLKSTLLS